MWTKYASLPENSRGRLVFEKQDWHRNDFQRDRDRIINSASFRRLQYKTQVFTNHEGDHYRTRLTHSLEVAQIAKLICARLNLCEDLAEILALAHDIGHPPFGHAGEDALNEMTKEIGGFDHNIQTFKLITLLESRYAKFEGLNLTWESLEGIVKHNGPIIGKYKNKKISKIPNLIIDFSKKFDLELDKFPSLEAQITALADDIAYNNHDIEDGLRAGLISIEDISKINILGEIINSLRQKYHNIDDRRLIHETTRRTVRVMIDDVINQIKHNIKTHGLETLDDIRNFNQTVVNFSPKILQGCNEIRALLEKNVYNHVKVNRMTNKARRVVKELFKLYNSDTGCLPTEWKMKIDKTTSNTEVIIIISDFIAGMTDRYALKEYMSFFDLSLNESQL